VSVASGHCIRRRGLTYLAQHPGADGFICWQVASPFSVTCDAAPRLQSAEGCFRRPERCSGSFVLIRRQMAPSADTELVFRSLSLASERWESLFRMNAIGSSSASNASRRSGKDTTSMRISSRSWRSLDAARRRVSCNMFDEWLLMVRDLKESIAQLHHLHAPWRPATRDRERNARLRHGANGGGPAASGACPVAAFMSLADRVGQCGPQCFVGSCQ
jgi:hypothetical protein